MTPSGPIDCDIHPAVPAQEALLPYLPGHWPDAVIQRGIAAFDTASYPDNGPLTARPDWRPKSGRPGSDLEQLRLQALDGFGTSLAICNCLYGVHALFSADMAAAFAQAVNDWMAREWLDAEPRLRASIVVPIQSPELAVAEIERLADDRRFVQVLLPVFADMPLGNRYHWPIYEAAERHGLTIGIHAGSTYRRPATSSGWPTYHLEDYINQAQGFQTQLASLICEGVFKKYPDLTVVMIESGFTWLPACAWRLNKTWQGLRMEVPWVDVPPMELVRRHVRFTLQPVDAPPDPALLDRVMDHMGSDSLILFSTDYPHWHFDDDEALPEGLSKDLLRKIQIDNPLQTYPRLTETIQ